MSTQAAPIEGIAIAVSDEVRLLLAARRMRERRLTEVLRLSPGAVSMRMRGLTPWTLADLEALARYFDVDANTLLPGLGQHPREDISAAQTLPTVP